MEQRNRRIALDSLDKRMLERCVELQETLLRALARVTNMKFIANKHRHAALSSISFARKKCLDALFC